LATPQSKVKSIESMLVCWSAVKGVVCASVVMVEASEKSVTLRAKVF
jgi:hypothetical protein